MAELLFLSVLILIAWSACCVRLGQIYEVERRLRELRQVEAAELNAKDEWVTRMESKGAA